MANCLWSLASVSDAFLGSDVDCGRVLGAVTCVIVMARPTVRKCGSRIGEGLVSVGMCRSEMSDADEVYALVVGSVGAPSEFGSSLWVTLLCALIVYKGYHGYASVTGGDYGHGGVAWSVVEVVVCGGVGSALAVICVEYAVVTAVGWFEPTVCVAV